VPTPLISVIVPVYNGEKRLESCLRSILTQDERDLEILVVDDGSTDRTWAILQDMAQKDSRIHPIHQENAGVSSARNTALDVCRGKYIRFVDADDRLPEGAISTMVQHMEAAECDLVVAAYTEVVGTLRYRRCLAPDAVVLPMEDFLHHLCSRSNSFYYGVLWNKLFRGDIIRQQGIRFVPHLDWGEDFFFVTTYLRHAKSIGYIGDVVYDYYRSVSGMTTAQFMDCVRHPLSNCQVKWRLYQNYRRLYIWHGVYQQYRRVLWLYLFRVTLNN